MRDKRRSRHQKQEEIKRGGERVRTGIPEGVIGIDEMLDDVEGVTTHNRQALELSQSEPRDTRTYSQWL